MVALTVKFSQKDKILMLQVTYSRDFFAKKLSDWNRCKIWLLRIADENVFLVYNENIRLNAEKGFKANWENPEAESSLWEGEFELKYKLREKNATERRNLFLYCNAIFAK